MTVGVDLNFQLGPSHLLSAFRDVTHPFEVVLDVFVLVGSDEVPDRCGRRYDIRCSAAISNDIVQSGVLFSVFPHEINADVHQFDRVQCAAAFFRSAGSVR